MSQDDQSTENRSFTVNRRSMLALMGAGGASLAMAGGLGSSAAQQDDGADGDTGGGVSADRCEPCIDPYTGYLVPAGASAGGTQTENGGGAVQDNETDDNESDGNETFTPQEDNETAANETDDNETFTPEEGNESDDNESDDGLVEPGFLDDNDTDDNESEDGGGAQSPAGGEAFDADVTISLNVDDADVVFPDEEGGGATDDEMEDNESDTMGDNETEDEAGLADNETDDNESDTGLTDDNETDDNESDGGLTDNESDDGAMGNESDNETAEAIEAATDTQASVFTQQEQDGFPDFYFDPVGVRVAPGDVVAFEPEEDVHTVTAYHPRYYDLPQRVPDNTAGFSSPPIRPGDTWFYQFDEPGVYDLFCLPHEQFGMVIRVVVMEEDGEVPEAPSEGGTATDEGTDTTDNETETTDNETDEMEDNETDTMGDNETDTGNETDTMDDNETGGGATSPETDVQQPGPSQAGPSDIAMSVFNSPEMDPQNIADQEEVAWTDLTEVEAQPPAGD